MLLSRLALLMSWIPVGNPVDASESSSSSVSAQQVHTTFQPGVLIERDRVRRWISVEDARLYVDRLSTAADVRDCPSPGPQLTRDPDDDFIIYLARENNADMIVSGDSDLLDWPEQRPPVVAPGKFKRILGQK